MGNLGCCKSCARLQVCPLYFDQTDRFKAVLLAGVWHIVDGMKALKSKLAAELLADPRVSAQLRKFLVTSRMEPDPQTSQFILGEGRSARLIEATWVLRPVAKAD